MKTNFTRFLFLLLPAILFTPRANAQFFKNLPQMNNYIFGDVYADTSGITFSVFFQDPDLGHHRTLLHTDNAGEVLWVKEASSNFGDHLNLPDGSVIVSGIRPMANGERNGLLEKHNADGSVAWTRRIGVSGGSLGIGNLMLNDNKIILTVNRSSFFSNTDMHKGAIMALDFDGNPLWTKVYANGGFTTDYSISRTMIAANGDILAVADIRGSSNSPANGMMLTRLTNAGVMVFAKYVDFRTTHNQLSVTGLEELPNGDIVFGGRLMTDQISTYSNTMWLGKTDAAGNLLLQKTYHGGTDTGEQLHSLKYANDKLYAYVQMFAPFDSMDVQRTLMIGELDPATLSFTQMNALQGLYTFEDPYGQVPNAFAVTTDGMLTVVAGSFCEESERYHTVLMQMDPDLSSSCTASEATHTFTDSIANYIMSPYVPSNSFSVTTSVDTLHITLTEITPYTVRDFCEGCALSAASVKEHTGDALQIYPNPTDGRLYVLSENPAEGSVVTVFNTVGAIVYSGRLSSGQTMIDLDANAPGLYYVYVTLDGQQPSVHKIIKRN